jgi:hypothetical protein
VALDLTKSRKDLQLEIGENPTAICSAIPQNAGNYSDNAAVASGSRCVICQVQATTRHFQYTQFLHSSKELIMNKNQKGGHNTSQSGSKQSTSQGSQSQQSGSQGSQNSQSGNSAGKGTQGGTHEQHVEAGRQSHKNDGNKQSGSQGSGSSSRGNKS